MSKRARQDEWKSVASSNFGIFVRLLIRDYKSSGWLVMDELSVGPELKSCFNWFQQIVGWFCLKWNQNWTKSLELTPL
jgi:hypothetical protein